MSEDTIITRISNKEHEAIFSGKVLNSFTFGSSIKRIPLDKNWNDETSNNESQLRTCETTDPRRLGLGCRVSVNLKFKNSYLEHFCTARNEISYLIHVDRQ